MIGNLCQYSCIFCDSLSGRKLDLCRACEQDLPFLPNYCTRCTTLLPDGRTLCGSCLGSFSADILTTVLFYYEPPIDHLITNLKFHNDLVSVKILGELLSDHLYIKYLNRMRPEVIVPVPLHSQRLRERGYNQALELSRPVARRLKLPLDVFSIIRVKNTLPQAQLPAKKRQQNIKRAFQIIQDFNYHHVAVVDDVITTGNTIFELCRCLSLMGVKRIDVWCCAKSVFKNL